MTTEQSMTSAQLHEAVARYRVMISRWARTGGRSKELVAEDKRYQEALKLQGEIDAKLALQEPDLAGCMCRSLAVIEMSNRAEVAKILGYGPNFCHARAEAAVRAIQAQEAQGV